MAYRGGAGVWIAIVFLAILAIAFGALYMRREADLTMINEAIRKETIAALANAEKWNNPHARTALEEAEKATNAMKEQRETILAKDNEIRARDDKIDEQRKSAEALETKVKSLETEIENLKVTIKEYEEKWTKVRNERQEDLRGEITNLRDINLKQQTRNEELNRKLTKMEELQEALRQAYQRRVIELQRENHALRQVIEKFEKETRGRVEIMKEEYDGKIIQVDIDNKFVVVDLGHAHRLQRGMIFDVIRWRLNRWDFMGAVQITKVGTTTSQGVILDAIMQEKVCPITGWTAPDPEMKYSPYAAGGAENDRVVPLAKSEVVEKPSMRKLDPIVIGDYITNPFYSQQRVLKFVVAGQPVHFSPNEVKQQIKNYGGEVQAAVDVDTDYLVLGAIPEEGSGALMEKEESRQMREQAIKARETAKQYGIPILREVELFSFLRN